jgi:G6PDH family F420-dependent oxidoreductase
MPEIGYFLSSEEHGPRDLARFAAMGEEAGFGSVFISDHYHPWTERQGQSPFVWSVIGAIAAKTKLRVTTGVTCPIMRIHPAIIAQAAATCSLLLEGRFILGVGTGEALNEHILGDTWPPAQIRQDMLEEAIELMRELWQGDFVNHRGAHYRVDNARLYSSPDVPPPVYISGFGPDAIRLAAQVGDGYVNVAPLSDAVRNYRESGGDGPAVAGIKVCWGEDEDAAKKLAHDVWKTTGVPGELNQELPLPRHFEQAAELVTEEIVAEAISCGPDPQRHEEAVRKYLDAGYDEIYISQIGDDQAGFLQFFFKELRPRLGL